jgi:nuclear GTP-binding protein
LKVKLKENAAADEDEEGTGSGVEGDTNKAASYDGVATLHSASTSVPTAKSKLKAVATDFDEEDEVPVLLDPKWPHLQAVLNDADVIIEVLDARDPFAYRSAQIEKFAADAGKRILFVLNKIGAFASICLRLG